MNSRLYMKANMKNSNLMIDKTKVKTKSLKPFILADENVKSEVAKTQNIVNPEIKTSNSKQLVLPSLVPYNNRNQIKKNENPKIQKNQLNSRLATKKERYKEYLKQNILMIIVRFLDSKSAFNFSLSNKKFYKCVIENDELFFYLYRKKFNSGVFVKNQSKWRSFYMSSVTNLYKSNYNSLSKKFLMKMKKNEYVAKRDPYFIPNQLYKNMRPIYKIFLDDKEFPVKIVFKNDILTHINFYTNFDDEYINLNKLKNIKLTLSEKNLGFSNKIIKQYELKRNNLEKLEKFGVQSKICKFYGDGDVILTSFEENLVFFINFSIPICKICEIFDFIEGMHGKNLSYFDDISSKFGMFDYTLILNIKNYNELFFSIFVNKLDFKDTDSNDYTYINTNQVVSNTCPYFNLKTIALQEKIYNMLILDIFVLNSNGDHIICNSFPMVLNTFQNLDLDNTDYECYKSIINHNDYNLEINLKYSKEMGIYIFDGFVLNVKKSFIHDIYKKH